MKRPTPGPRTNPTPMDPNTPPDPGRDDLERIALERLAPLLAPLVAAGLRALARAVRALR